MRFHTKVDRMKNSICRATVKRKITPGHTAELFKMPAKI